MLQAIARFTYRRRRLVVLGWIALFIGLVFAASAAGGAYRTDFRLEGSESSDAFDLLKQSGFVERSGTQGQIVFETSDGVDDPAVESTMTALFDDIERAVPRTSVESPYAPFEGARQIAADGTVAYAEVNLAERSQEGYQRAADTIEALTEQVDVPGLTVSLGGDMFWNPEVSGVSEGIGILAAMVILLIAFGSALAMGLPIVTALFGIGCAAALVMIARNLIDMPDFTMSAVAMVGIGVGIDYALLIVTRFRESLDSGLDPEHAVIRSINTAGRASMFAGFTVMISVLGMLFMNLGSMDGVAIAISIGVAMTMIASITLLPALLGFVGHNITRFGLPHRKVNPRGTVWKRWSLRLQRRPWPYAILGTAILLLLASPVLGMRLGFGDGGNNPETDTTRIAYDTLSRGFGPGFNGPLLIAAATPGGADDAAAIAALQETLADTAGVASVSPTLQNDDGTVTIMQVFPTTAPQDAETADLVTTLRDDVIPDFADDTGLEVKVGGVTAAVDDFAEYTTERLPVFIGLVMILSFLLLMVVFRSLLVPLKAVIMNLLSIAAAYGVVVAVFQWGWGAGLLGIPKAGPIEAWAPIFLFAVVFGLSMDYEVFLLSRIKEEYDRHGDNASAVANGLAVTARVITAAAAIMICVFGSFVFGPDRSLQLFGLGLAVAVLIDATLVRLVLVPATMELLGDRNWWLPRWLEFLPRVHVEPAEDIDAELDALTDEERSVPV